MSTDLYEWLLVRCLEELHEDACALRKDLYDDTRAPREDDETALERRLDGMIRVLGIARNAARELREKARR